MAICAKEHFAVDTVFIGGGTPSVLPVGYHTRLYEMLENTFDLSPLCEYTVEVNPGTLTPELAGELKAIGVTRISMGAQSIHENELKRLGRIHNYADVVDAFSVLRAVGFTDINVDLMYGIPEQTPESLDKTLTAILALDPTHISAYSLIVEEGTPFGNTDLTRLDLPSEDSEAAMQRLLTDRMREAGFGHYEISNYAKSGFECRHNLKYWHCEEYIGIGAAAHSYLDGRRYGNTRELFSVVRDPEACAEGGTPEEYIMMHLRTSRGLLVTDFIRRFDYDPLQKHAKTVEKYENLGLLTVKDGRIALTEDGFAVSNSVILEFMMDLP